MASSYRQFKEMNLNRDEVERLTEALKNKNFRKLLTDYVDEVQDPENKKKYQEEIAEFEKERGVDVIFINPIAGYVIKTSVNGDEKAFINICSNENISKPTSTIAVVDGLRGRHWTVPHVLAPPRHDYDKKMIKCQVYDVVFHPETLHLCHKFKAFNEMVNKTACDAIELNFDVILDRKNLKFPKLQFKGMSHATVLRKPSKEPPKNWTPEEKAIMDEFYSKVGANYAEQKIQKSSKKNKPRNYSKSAYTTPKYIIKHRRDLSMEEFTEHKTAKMSTATPKELIVEIDLPLLKSSSDVSLDVSERNLQLISEKPAKYNLSVTLPYKVSHDFGSAKFVKDQKKLIVTLPVVNKLSKLVPNISKNDNDSIGSNIVSFDLIDSNNVKGNSIEIMVETGLDEKSAISSSTGEGIPTFLDPNLHYFLPEFVTTRFNSTIAFTLNVKNVDNTSVAKEICNNSTGIHLKFTSISSGFYPTHYALFLKFPECVINNDFIEVWDNNVIVQICLKRCNILHSYYYGVDDSCLREKNLSDASTIIEEIINEIEFEDKKKEPVAELESLNLCAATINSLSESSGDELSCGYSPSKSKGILKEFRNCRRFGRSISESGLDEVIWTSSVENFTSVDSIIPEEEEISSSLKKTVRFNDVVSRKLFRSNSSILGQKKKKSWKAKNKKRSRDRSHSEGEVPDAQVLDSERDSKTTKESDNEIFQLDVN